MGNSFQSIAQREGRLEGRNSHRGNPGQWGRITEFHRACDNYPNEEHQLPSFHQYLTLSIRRGHEDHNTDDDHDLNHDEDDDDDWAQYNYH